MVKTQKTITREILEEELATRANAKLKTEIGSIIRGELDDIIDEYGLSDTESLEKLLGKNGIKINITQKDLVFTLKM